MNTYKYIIEKIQYKAKNYKLQLVLHNILHTPPATIGNDEFVLLSMVHHKDVKNYLLAVKTFCSYIHPKKIIVIADKSLNAYDFDILKKHVNGVEIFPSEKFANPDIPKGGTWERLIAISEINTIDYVVQLDADTVTIGEIIEIKNNIKESCSFLIGTEDNQKFLPVYQAALWAKEKEKEIDHIQITAEAVMDRFIKGKSAYYTRGCSGFSGFAKGVLSRELLVDLSRSMRDVLKERVNEWGTEQFASNYIISNTTKSSVLPHPKYCHPDKINATTVFIHFIGYLRFKTSFYDKMAKKFIQECARN